jgi:hypothetical protein
MTTLSVDDLAHRVIERRAVEGGQLGRAGGQL